MNIPTKTRPGRQRERVRTRRFRMAVLASLALIAFGCNDESPSQVSEISSEEFISNPPANMLVLDVRTSAEFDAGHVPHAVHVPHDQLAGRLEDLAIETDRPIVVYCKSGGRAGKAATVLLDAGYERVLHLTGDMDGWRASGLPVE